MRYTSLASLRAMRKVATAMPLCRALCRSAAPRAVGECLSEAALMRSRPATRLAPRGLAALIPAQRLALGDGCARCRPQPRHEMRLGREVRQIQADLRHDHPAGPHADAVDACQIDRRGSVQCSAQRLLAARDRRGVRNFAGVSAALGEAGRSGRRSASGRPDHVRAPGAGEATA